MKAEHLTKGQKVMVLGQNDVWDGEVTKIGRKWVTVSGPWHRVARFDIETQKIDSMYGAHFYTMPQWREREERAEAIKFLHGQGIWLASDSTWSAVDLAGLIKAHEERDRH